MVENETDIDNSLKIIAKGGVILLIGALISKLLGYVYRIIVANMGSEYYGMISLGLAFLGIITTISLMGLNNAVWRYVPYFRGKGDMSRAKGAIYFSLKISILTSILLSLLLYPFLDDIAIKIFHNSDLTIILRILTFVIPFCVINNIFYMVYKGFEKARYEVYTKNIFENISKILITLFVIFFVTDKMAGLSWAIALSAILTTVYGFYLMERKVFSFFRNKIIPIYSNKEIIIYSLPLFLTSVFPMIFNWFDTIMLGYFKDLSTVGIYNAAVPTAQLLYIIPYSISGLFIPVLTKLYSQNKQFLFSRIYKIVDKWILSLNLIILGLFILFSKTILSLFGQEYIQASNALIILSIGFVFNYSLINSTNLFMIHKKGKIILSNSLAVSILNIILNILLIPPFGIMGAAIATTISQIILRLLFLIESYVMFNLNSFSKKDINVLFSFILATFIFYKISEIFYPTTILYLILFSFSFLLVYGLMLFLTRSFEDEDKKIISAIIKKTYGFFNL